MDIFCSGRQLWEPLRANYFATGGAAMARAAYLLPTICLAGVALAAGQDDAAADGTVAGGSEGGFAGFTSAFGSSFMVILATEVGDRTFFIAAIMAMRYSRLLVWSGAVGALVVMTVLATVVGHVAPLLISRTYTQYAAAALFLFFGVRMLRDGLSVDHAGASEELEEVEAELTKKQVRRVHDAIRLSAYTPSASAEPALSC